jgi:probable rRNA maturation factor
MPASHISLEVAEARLNHPSESDIDSWVSGVLKYEDRAGEVSVVVVDETAMAELNQQYRGKDGPTNVLSFPADLPQGVPLALLGDIVLCSPLVEQEAQQQGKTTEAHWTHLVVHGTLHLLGYDHENDEDAEQMERREIEILADFGIANPYS